jgi:aspartyl/asparaginyl beta-hydroxylase (cupin superfamily)
MATWTDLRERFPFLDYLEQHVDTFREEVDTLPLDVWTAMPSEENYQGAWRAFPLALGAWVHEFPGANLAKNRLRCPRTAALLDQIEGLGIGGFLRLEEGAVIHPHRDLRDDHELRVHLGLRLPPHERAYWPEGTARVMDIRMEHEARNPGPGPRIALMVDVRMPYVIPDNVLPRWGAPA